jgi:pimeloyl-ACP methyl ester carboxylesterase
MKLFVTAILLISSLSFGAQPVIPYGSNPAAGHRAEVNGIKLYYETYGDGPLLVLLHGNGGSIEAMRYQADYFRQNRTVVAIDSRGHGHSEMGKGRLTYEQMADDVAALIPQLDRGRADIFGWSDGGIIALLVARRHPEAVHAIALSGANLTPEALKPEDLAGMKSELHVAEEKLRAGDTSRPWATVCQYLQLMITQPHISTEDLRLITGPALVLAGEHDMIPEPHTRAIAAGLPNSDLHIFPQAGHAALMEVPDVFNAALETFFRQASRSIPVPIK